MTLNRLATSCTSTDLPLYVNAELRAMTDRPEIFERSVMRSSVMPSEKYSCSGSPLMLVKGSTTIDGRSVAEASVLTRDIAMAGRGEGDAVDPDRPLDVLQHLLAHVLEGELEPVADVIANRARDGDAAGNGDAFQARCYVDAVAENVVGLENHVADIDADAKQDAALFRHSGVALSHSALHLGGTGDGVHDARKLREHAVTGQLDDAALMFRDLRVDQLVAMDFQRSERTGLVGAHEAAVADDIGGKDGRHPALHAIHAGVAPSSMSDVDPTR